MHGIELKLVRLIELLKEKQTQADKGHCVQLGSAIDEAIEIVNDLNLLETLNVLNGKGMI